MKFVASAVKVGYEDYGPAVHVIALYDDTGAETLVSPGLIPYTYPDNPTTVYRKFGPLTLRGCDGMLYGLGDYVGSGQLAWSYAPATGDIQHYYNPPPTGPDPAGPGITSLPGFPPAIEGWLAYTVTALATPDGRSFEVRRSSSDIYTLYEWVSGGWTFLATLSRDPELYWGPKVIAVALYQDSLWYSVPKDDASGVYRPTALEFYSRVGLDGSVDVFDPWTPGHRAEDTYPVLPEHVDYLLPAQAFNSGTRWDYATSTEVEAFCLYNIPYILDGAGGWYPVDPDDWSAVRVTPSLARAWANDFTGSSIIARGCYGHAYTIVHANLLDPVEAAPFWTSYVRTTEFL